MMDCTGVDDASNREDDDGNDKGINTTRSG